MKDLGAFGTHLAGDTGLDPIQFVQVTWPGLGVVTYVERLPTEGSSLSPTLVNKIPIRMDKANHSFGEVRQASVTVFDSDGTLRDEIEDNIVEGSDCKVGFMYYGAGDTALTTIFQGKLKGPLDWSEGDRRLSFDVVTQPNQIDYQSILTETVLNASPFSSMDNLADDLVDQIVPKVLGSVLDMPAMRITRRLQGVLTTTININHPDVESPLVADSTQFRIKPDPGDTTLWDGILAGIGSVSTVMIEGFVIGATFQEYLPDTDEFLFGIDSNFDNGLNVKKYSLSHPSDNITELTWADRDSSDFDYDNPKVAWLNKDGFDIRGNCVRVSDRYQQVNRCVRQKGRKCWFENPWMERTQVVGQDDLREVSVILGTDDIVKISMFRDRTFLDNYLDATKDTLIQLTNGSTVEPWGHLVTMLGVSYYSGTFPDIYLIRDNPTDGNANELTSVKSENSITSILSEVPFNLDNGRGYYGIYTNWNLTGFTALVLPLALSSYPNEGWSDTIMVTQRSSIGDPWVDGTTDYNHVWGNPVGMIQRLLEIYATQYTIDNDSFSAARAATEDYPHGFALRRKTDFFVLLGDIAWQSGLAIVVDGSVVKIKELTLDKPVSDGVLDESLILQQTMMIQIPEAMDLITEFRYNFQRRGSEEPIEKFITTNADDAGENPQTYAFYTINTERVADAIAAFWANRFSKLWRKFNLKLPAESLNLETFDQVEIDLSGIIGSYTSLSPTLTEAEGEVVSVAYDPGKYEITTVIETPYEVGSTTKDANYWALASVTMPQNLASINYKSYTRIFETDEIPEHGSSEHRDINLTSRFDDEGNKIKIEAARRSILNQDVLMWDNNDEEFIPVNIEEYLENEGWEPPTGSGTTNIVYNLGIWQR